MRAGSRKYARLLHDMKLKIVSGELPEGVFIPSENSIARQYGLSRPTVRKALAELAQEGLVQSIPGKGTVVLGPTAPRLKVTLLNLYWFLPSNEYPIIRMVVDRFNAEHKHIQVRLVPFSSGLVPSLSAAYRNTTLHDHKPDLISLSNRFLLELQAERMNDFLHPLRQLELPAKDDVYDFLWGPAMQGGELFAVPVTFSPVMLVYNRSMFDEAGLAYPDGGWTWDDLVRAAVKLTRQHADGTMQYGFAFSPSYHRWPLFYIQGGGQFGRDEAANGQVGGDAGIRFILDLIYEHRVSPLLFPNSDLGEQFFRCGRVGMILSTYYLCEPYRSNPFEWGICKFPRGAYDRSLAISTHVGISRESENVHEAQYFMQYLLSTPIQAFIKANSTTIPAVRPVAESADYPHYSFGGSGYYTFQETLGDIRLVNDLGLNHMQVQRLSQAMEMVWFRTESFERMWRAFAGELLS